MEEERSQAREQDQRQSCERINIRPVPKNGYAQGSCCYELTVNQRGQQACLCFSADCDQHKVADCRAKSADQKKARYRPGQLRECSAGSQWRQQQRSNHELGDEQKPGAIVESDFPSCREKCPIESACGKSKHYAGRLAKTGFDYQ